MDYRVTYITGCAPNLPWWKALTMTDEEIKAYNDQFLTYETSNRSGHMTDIVEKLKDRRTIDGSVSYVEMHEQVLDDAIYEIERLRRTIEQLRSVAGAVSLDVVSLADIKKDPRKFTTNPVLGEFTDGK